MHAPGRGPGPAPAAASGGTSTLDPVKLLKQYYPYLVLAVMFGTGLGVALHFLLMYTYPQYTSTVMLECMGKRTRQSEGREELGRDEQERFVGTQVQLLMSRLILEDALLRTREIRETAWAQPFLDEKRVIDTNKALRQLEKQMSARPLPQSNLIQLRVSTKDPKDSAILVNAIADAFMRDHRGTGSSSVEEQKRVLGDTVKKLEEDIKRLKGEREQVLKDAKLDSTGTAESGEKVAFDDLSKQLNECNVTLSAVRSQRETYKRQILEGQVEIAPNDIKEEAQRDPVVQQYDQKIATYKDTLGARRKLGYGDNHPDIQMIIASIAECEVQRQQKLAEVVQRLWAAQLTQLDNAVISLEAQKQKIEADLAELKERRELIAIAQVRVRTLDGDIEVATADLSKARAQLREIEGLSVRSSDSEGMLGDRVRVISRGVIPKSVSFPKIEIVVPATAVLFTGLVGGILFLREILDQRVRGPSDAAMVPRVKVLGIVPDASEDPSRPTSIETVFRDNPTGVLTESYRQMRAPLIQAMERSGHKSLVVLGCMPGSGATSVVTNMALAVAGADERVLIIDANFRRPSIHRVFKLDEGPGLGDILAGTTSLDQALQGTSNDALKVLTAGTAGSRAIPERLAGEAMSRLLLEASTRFDMIIVDVPPAVVSGDGYALANKCDASVIVCRAMVEKRGLLARVRSQLGESRAEFLGVVVNAVRASAGGYIKRNIKATHSYQLNGKG